MKGVLSKAKGITLIALVITIIIIIILAGITINLTIGENGIFTKSKQAREEYQKKAATEILNLKITEVQMKTYTKEQKLPTLKNVADAFCKDGDFQYVADKKKVATNEDKPFLLPEIENQNPDSIFVILNAYPYQFEIDNKLRLASIDGVKIANNEPMGNFVLKSEYESLKSSYDALTEKLKDYDSIVSKVNTLESTIETLSTNLQNLQTSSSQTSSGSYTGNGTMGPSNKNTLTFDKAPKVVIIYSNAFGGGLNTGGTIFMQGCSYSAIGTFTIFNTNSTVSSAGPLHANCVTWTNNGKTMSWYNPTNVGSQLNESGIKYNYVAIY